jgi:hypothetical protein
MKLIAAHGLGGGQEKRCCLGRPQSGILPRVECSGRHEGAVDIAQCGNHLHSQLQNAPAAKTR